MEIAISFVSPVGFVFPGVCLWKGLPAWGIYIILYQHIMQMYIHCTLVFILTPCINCFNVWVYTVYVVNLYTVCVYACIHASMHPCIHPSIHPYIHTHIHTYTYTLSVPFRSVPSHTYIHTCIHTYIDT